jgi:hypothetical protein
MLPRTYSRQFRVPWLIFALGYLNFIKSAETLGNV